MASDESELNNWSVSEKNRGKCRTFCKLLVFLGGCCILGALIIYYWPLLDVYPVVVAPYVHVPMTGVLRPPKARDFLVERLLHGRVFAPESVAIDSSGHVYMVVHGGHVLRAKFSDPPSPEKLDESASEHLELIAELNEGFENEEHICKRDQQLHGDRSLDSELLDIAIPSRCSIPLGVRLSRDENFLYVIDTLQGLFRIDLKVALEPRKPQNRVVTQMLDWNRDAIRVTHYTNGQPLESTFVPNLRSMDDLAIDEGAGTNGGDLIYMSSASIKWKTHEFMYAIFESRYTGFILRYDTGSQQLTALENMNDIRKSPDETCKIPEDHDDSVTLGPLGAPKMDANDVIDTRYNAFWNGLELSDDRQALFVTDTANRRIIKHYIRGARTGQSDLWTWLPLSPDNIRRGAGKRETYWVCGCGNYHAPLISQEDINIWPRSKRLALKTLYLIGESIEYLGEHVFRSPFIADLGSGIRSGMAFPSVLCHGMILLQYDRNGAPIRSIHGPEFPTDMRIMSEAHEFISTTNKSLHMLYLGSPNYPYIARISWSDNTDEQSDFSLQP